MLIACWRAAKAYLHHHRLTRTILSICQPVTKPQYTQVYRHRWHLYPHSSIRARPTLLNLQPRHTLPGPKQHDVAAGMRTIRSSKAAVPTITQMRLEDGQHSVHSCGIMTANTLVPKLKNSCSCNFHVQVIEAIAKERSLDKPSVSYGAENLYMHGPLEELTKHNLSKV